MLSTNSLHELTRTAVGRKVLYPELSYEVMGAVFEVNKDLGFGYPEKVYQLALVKELEKRRLPFRRENFSRIAYKGQPVGRYFHDFVIDDKIVLELKVAKDLYESHVNQLLSYLRNNDFKLGILIVFTPRGVLYRRVVF